MSGVHSTTSEIKLTVPDARTAAELADYPVDMPTVSPGARKIVLAKNGARLATRDETSVLHNSSPSYDTFREPKPSKH